MSNISFIVNNNLANTFIKELYIGFNWDPLSVAVTLSTASYVKNRNRTKQQFHH